MHVYDLTVPARPGGDRELGDRLKAAAAAAGEAAPVRVHVRLGGAVVVEQHTTAAARLTSNPCHLTTVASQPADGDRARLRCTFYVPALRRWLSAAVGVFWLAVAAWMFVVLPFVKGARPGAIAAEILAGVVALAVGMLAFSGMRPVRHRSHRVVLTWLAATLGATEVPVAG